MKLLYFMALMIFGANADVCDPSSKRDSRTWNYFLNYTTENLTIAENLTTLLCKWNGSQCYVECPFLNLTTNTTGLNNMTGHFNQKQWTPHIFQQNVQGITCMVKECVCEKMKSLITDSNSTDLKYLRRPTRIKKMCTNLFASDSDFKKVYISAEKRYIDALISAPFNGTAKNFDKEEFNMIVVKMDKMNTSADGLVQISAPTVPGDALSLDVFVPTECFVNVSVGIVAYPSAQQFIQDANTVLKTKVIRIETAGKASKHLSKPLSINFTLKTEEIISENYTLSCQFYDEKEYKWNHMGSFTDLKNFNSSNTVICSYDHMTPFAVLMVANVTEISPQQWKILSYISYIGCSLSSFFSAVTIFLYVFMKSSNRNSSIHIHASLSIALFLLNTSFLFIELGATWSKDSCVVIAVIVQYSLLSCFSWMAIEAIHLYLLLIKVFNTYIKHYMVKLSLFGWGVPAVLVGGSLCAFRSKPFYGLTSVTLSNETTQLCWITDIRFLYGMNIPYFSLTFLFNMCILVAVTRQIFKLRSLNASKLPSRKDICTVLSLTFLLGMTWGLAFFTSGYTNYFILYLFCICNSLQGLFLFLWFCGTVKKNRHLEAQSSTMSEPASATVKTYESSFSN